ncbi:MAG TPA: EAL domain-containing protein [Planococcus sp. (in: firmicutes)]|nr:EAL domain-containing protein [Planococcus sp. (in: firmicutes)]
MKNYKNPDYPITVAVVPEKDVDFLENEHGQIQDWINTIDEFLIAIDENGKIIRVNQAWVDFCKEHDVRESLWKSGADYFEQLESRGKTSELHSLKQVLASEINEHRQIYPFITGSGETQWLQVKIRGVKSASGQVTGAIVHHKPMTLHSAHPITAEIVLESMTEGFFLLDDHLQVIYMNEIAEEILEYKRGNAAGWNLFTLFPEALDTNFPHHYRRALTEQTIVEFVDYYKPLDKWFQVKACPLSKGGLSVYFQDVSEKKKTEVQLTEYAYYDYLTRLPNRKLIIQRIQSLLEQGKKFSIVHLTIDNLNFINSIYTHNAGDTIMKKVAEELKGFASETCHIGRSDGNEFLIVRESAHGERLAGIIEQLEGIFYKSVFLENAQKVNISSSIGIACYPFDALTMDELLSYAEIAMCEAKIGQGISHAFFRPQMLMQRNRRAIIEEGLDSDLKKNGFYYTLQPQVDGHSGRIVGVEVLSRWAHPELGVISPPEFIQVAEETGQIVPLTSHLLAEVFAQMKEWEKEFGWNLRTAINMTASLLSNSDFFKDFIELMERFEIDPKLIEIEITEQAELTYSPKTLENLLLCKSKGMSIAIDDFGTGFSMISYLTHFPITKIKIDRFFVQKIGQNLKSESVLKSLIYLARSIECELVAEGVERAEEAEFLLANDCSIFQGYLYDRPMNVADFQAKYLQAGHAVSTKRQSAEQAKQ